MTVGFGLLEHSEADTEPSQSTANLSKLTATLGYWPTDKFLTTCLFVTTVILLSASTQLIYFLERLPPTTLIAMQKGGSVKENPIPSLNLLRLTYFPSELSTFLAVPYMAAQPLLEN